MMFLKLVICCSLAVAVSALPSKRGACVVMCSPGEGIFDTLGLNECPAGQVCRSTGCGAMCQHVEQADVSSLSASACWDRPICNNWCPNGHEVDADGCPLCSCKPTACLGVMCALYCPNGFALGQDGCPSCSCNTVQLG